MKISPDLFLFCSHRPLRVVVLTTSSYKWEDDLREYFTKFGSDSQFQRSAKECLLKGQFERIDACLETQDMDSTSKGPDCELLYSAWGRAGRHIQLCGSLFPPRLIKLMKSIL